MEAPKGPAKDARTAPDWVRAELNKAGYAVDEEHALLPNQYFLIFHPG